MSIPEPNRFYGKFRGKVLDNVDPQQMGRILATVPVVTNELNWALPCVPYAGPGVGFLALPPIGAAVWIEFESGDLNYPIWVGGFWGAPEEMPVPSFPEIKVLQTEFSQILLNDTPGEGGLSFRVTEPVAATVTTLTFDVEGVKLRVPEAEIQATPEEIRLSIGQVSISMTASAVVTNVPH